MRYPYAEQSPPPKKIKSLIIIIKKGFKYDFLSCNIFVSILAFFVEIHDYKLNWRQDINDAIMNG